MSEKYDGLQQIIDEALESMAAEAAGDFDPQWCNLAEFCRGTGLSRQRARTIKANGFKARPRGRLGLKLASTRAQHRRRSMQSSSLPTSWRRRRIREDRWIEVMA